MFKKNQGDGAQGAAHGKRHDANFSDLAALFRRFLSDLAAFSHGFLSVLAA